MFKVGQIVKTRRGQRARIVATDMRNKYPILALVERMNEPNQESIITCTEDGHLCPDGIERDNDLMPPTKTVWLNLYRDGPGAVYYDTEKEARNVGARHRPAYVRCISIEIPE